MRVPVTLKNESIVKEIPEVLGSLNLGKDLRPDKVLRFLTKAQEFHASALVEDKKKLDAAMSEGKARFEHDGSKQKKACTDKNGAEKERDERDKDEKEKDKVKDKEINGGGNSEGNNASNAFGSRKLKVEVNPSSTL